MLLLLSGFVFWGAVANNLHLYQAGRKAFSVGLYSIALENFNQYLEGDSIEKKVDAVYLSGISAYYLKDYKNSLSYLASIEINFPDSGYVGNSFYWMGLNYYYLKDYEESIYRFSNNISIKSKYTDISWLYKALANIQLGKAIAAEICLNNIVDNPDAENRYKEEALYRLATLYLEGHDISSAVNTLNMIIFDFPNSKYYEESLSLLSDSYFILKEWPSAERSYKLLLKYKPGSETINKRLATIMWNIGEISQSKEYLIYCDENFDINKDILSMLGDVYISEGSLNEALTIYKRVETISSLSQDETDENRYRLGSLFYQLDNFDKAFNLFSLVYTKESLYFTILSGLKAERDVLPAIKKLNFQYRGDDYSFDSINRYINYLDMNSKTTELESFLIYITEIYPEEVTYSLTYGELLLESDRLDESLKYLSRGYNKDSIYYSNLSYKIGWIYYSKGEYARSISYFSQLKDTDDDYIKALYSESIAQYQIGELNKGRDGFLQLLALDTVYNGEISFYLGLIEKDSFRYENALGYFRSSMNNESLYIDSLNNIAWSYYHLKEYEKALEIYIDLDNSFNAANCYLFMEMYEESLLLYLDVVRDGGSLKSSAYYKSIEILFLLAREDEAFELVKKYLHDFPDSDLPGEVILANGDNSLYENSLDNAIKTFNMVMKLFPVGKEWFKARYRLAECYYLKKNYNRSIDIYIDSISSKDSYSSDSINHIVDILSEVSNPDLTGNTKLKLDSRNDKVRVIPIYIEYIRQGINRDNSLEDIENLISIARTRDEIDQLIYLKSLYYYGVDMVEDAEKTLKLILSRPEAGDDVKVDTIMLQAQILSDKGRNTDAIDLYLKLYINFTKMREKASHALYKALLLTKKYEDSDMEEKIVRILKNEYEDTSWGRRGLDEK